MYQITVLNGPNMGMKIQLDTNREYVIGRSDTCDIPIDRTDVTASRKHALLVLENKKITIQNLSQANPVMVRGTPVQSAVLRNKDEFQAGNSLFRLEKTDEKASPGARGKSASKTRLILVGLICLMCVGIIVMRFSKKAAPPETGTTPPPVTGAAAGAGSVSGQNIGKPVTAGPAFPMNVSPEARKKADQFFRQGMFFYETGKLPRALEEWAKAINSFPNHPDAKIWFLKTEQELEQVTRMHYQNGMLHYKYMRYNEAAHEFRTVLQLARNKSSDIYLDSLNYLNQIEGNANK